MREASGDFTPEERTAPGALQHGRLRPPHLAVAIPCYNAEAWVGRAIDSVLRQNYPALTLIVVDDGSTDGSVGRVRTYGSQVILRTGPNRGACHARNEGLRMAIEHNASHILFLDADDYLEGDILVGAARTAVAHDADLVLSNMHLEDDQGHREERFYYSGHVKPEAFFEGWMRTQYINPSAILWRTDFAEKIGGWDETLSRGQDLDFTLRAMLHWPVVWKNERGAAIHARVNGQSVSRNVSRKATMSRLRVQERLLESIRGTSFEQYVPLLCCEIYCIARTAFRTGQHDLGRRGLEILRAHKYREHPGRPLHRIAASALGLETKVRLWGG